MVVHIRFDPTEINRTIISRYLCMLRQQSASSKCSLDGPVLISAPSISFLQNGYLYLLQNAKMNETSALTLIHQSKIFLQHA